MKKTAFSVYCKEHNVDYTSVDTMLGIVKNYLSYACNDLVEDSNSSFLKELARVLFKNEIISIDDKREVCEFVDFVDEYRNKVA